MKKFSYLLFTLSILPFSAFALDGCPGNMLPLEGRCQEVAGINNPAINQLNFPQNAPTRAPESIRSNPNNPLIIDNNGMPYSIVANTIQGPWVVRSNAQITAQSISEWPFVEQPVDIVINGALPPGQPTTAPGITCNVSRQSLSSVRIKCTADRQWYYSSCMMSGLASSQGGSVNPVEYCQSWAAQRISY